ncbi:MAG TPA: metal-dependent transcriptional regulator [Flavobacteriaceae bacterium]|nr:metal-dependent transcriptional regulator [Flavobacteriaceae bacterium]
MTFSEENYLKAIFHLEEDFEDGVPTNALAEMMQTKASSATDMVKRLAEKKLLHYIPYQGVRLTENGEIHAIQVIRKHRLWETFLVEKLSFSWDEVHEIAEQLEHIKSEKLTDRLDKFLNFPKVDPHGDLIPNKKGDFPVINKVRLSECQAGDKGTLIGVEDSKEFLNFLDNQQISLHDIIEVVGKEEFDNSFTIEINSKIKTVSSKTAESLFLLLDVGREDNVTK